MSALKRDDLFLKDKTCARHGVIRADALYDAPPALVKLVEEKNGKTLFLSRRNADVSMFSRLGPRSAELRAIRSILREKVFTFPGGRSRKEKLSRVVNIRGEFT